MDQRIAAAIETTDNHVLPELEGRSFVAPQSEKGRLFSAYLGAIIDRLLKAEGIDLTHETFRLLVEESAEANAYILPTIDNPPIVVSYGLLRLMEYEDELAAVLRHEIQHYLLRHQKNSKAQEAACDLASVGSLRSADYHPEALALTLQRFPQGWERSIAGYFDVHPLGENRIRDVESLASIKNRKEGDAEQEWTPLNPEIKALVPAAKTKELRVKTWLAEKQFDDQFPEKQIELLDDYFLMASAEAEWDEKDQDYFAYTLNGVLIHPETDKEDEVFHLLDHILASRYYAFYKYVPSPPDDTPLDFFSGFHGLSANGPLYVLNENIKAFFAATTAAEAEQRASVINKTIDKYRDALDTAADGLNIHFAALSKAARQFHDSNGAVCAWAKHREWIRQGHSDLRKTLCHLGLKDDVDLPPSTEPEARLAVIFEHEKSFIATLKRPHKAFSAVFHDRSHLFGRMDDGYDFSIKAERKRDEIEIRRIAAKDAAETELVKQVDWSRLESDFDGFVSEYLDFLVPELTSVTNGKYVFASAFMSKMNAHLKANPDAYIPQMFNLFFFNRKTLLTGAWKERFSLKLLEINAGQVPNWYSPRVGFQLGDPIVAFILNYEEIIRSLAPEGEAAKQSFLAKHLPSARNSIGDALPQGMRKEILDKTAYLEINDLEKPIAEQFTIKIGDYFQKWSDEPTWKNVYTQATSVKNNLAINSRALLALFYKTIKANPEAILPPHHMCLVHASVAIEDSRLAHMIKAQQERNFIFETRPEAKIWDLLNRYVLYSTQKEFVNNEDLRVRYEKALMEKGASLTKAADKERLASALLFRQMRIGPVQMAPDNTEFEALDSSYTGRLTNHRFRKWAQNLLVEGMAARLGTDDGSERYYQKCVKAIDDLKKSTSKTLTLVEVLPDLAEKACAQPRAAFFMRDRRNQAFEKMGTYSTFVGAPIEITLNEIGKSEDLQLASIDFLTSPLTRASAYGFGSMAYKRVFDRLKYETRSINDLELDETDDMMIAHFSRVHREFWAAPFEARTWYLDKILFPPRHNGNDAAFNQAAALVINKAMGNDNAAQGDRRAYLSMKKTQIQSEIKRREQATRLAVREVHKDILRLRTQFPQILKPWSKEGRRYRRRLSALMQKERAAQRPGIRESLVQEFKMTARSLCANVLPYVPRLFSREKQVTRIMRQIAVSYLDTIPRNEKRLALSAVMAARSMAFGEQKHEETSTGKFAAQVLYYMDEIGGKILQALDSHPGVPAYFKKQMGDAKANYQKPVRWDALAWAQELGIRPETPGDEIAYYGPIVGSGSMGFTIFVRKKGGQNYADTILRPFARERTIREARNVVATAKAVARANKKLAAAPDIAAVAQRDALVETEMALAYKQAGVAAQVYNGLRTTATVNGKGYSMVHHAAATIAYSHAAKRSEAVYHTHFNDFPESTEEERAYKKALAIQLYGAELLLILSGKPCDRDRHGKNQLIEPGQINHFDFGMTALTMPTDEQKRALAQTLLAVFQGRLLFKDTASAFDQHLRDIEATKEVRQFLSGFRRQILALGDFEKQLSFKDKMKIMGAIVQSGHVDPIIAQEIKSSVVGDKAWWILSKIPTNIFSFDANGCEKNIKMPSLTEEEIKLINGIVVNKKSGVRIYKKPISVRPAANSDEPSPLHRLIKKMGLQACLPRNDLRASDESGRPCSRIVKRGTGRSPS